MSNKAKFSAAMLALLAAGAIFTGAFLLLPFIQIRIIVYDEFTNYRRFIMHKKRWSPCLHR